LHAIKLFLAKYTALLLALLKPLGVWGVFGIATLDGALFGLPPVMDVLVANYVYNDKPKFLLIALLAAVGSTLGSIVIYVIGRKGGQVVLRKRVSQQRIEEFQRKFAKQEFWGLMLPAMLPPPTPFKLIELAAAVFGMPLGKYLLAIFLGRCVRFVALSVLTLKFGPQFVHWTSGFFRLHFVWVEVAVGVGLLIWLILWRRKRSQAAPVAPTTGVIA
jgi:membrane protein YqaA with SNARE-associated domain